MNPEHAKAFNELRELCRKYKLCLFCDDEKKLIFRFNQDGKYKTYEKDLGVFSEKTENLKSLIDIPPPGTKGDKNE